MLFRSERRGRAGLRGGVVALEEVIHERKKGSTIKALLKTATPKTSQEKRLHNLIKRDFDISISKQLLIDLDLTIKELSI